MEGNEYNVAKIIKLRGELNITQEEMAHRLGVTRMMVHLAEAGKSCSWKLLRKYARYFDQPISLLLADAQTEVHNKPLQIRRGRPLGSKNKPKKTEIFLPEKVIPT